MTEDDYDDFVEELEGEYPKMFAEPYGGVATGAGWWPIIKALCGQIQSHVDHQNDLAAKHPGKYQPVKQVVVEQIKEKFGGLRFYYQGGDEQIHGMVRMAESWASRSCEECGNVGKRQGDGWIRTLCDFHIAEREALRAEQMKKDGLEE